MVGRYILFVFMVVPFFVLAQKKNKEQYVFSYLSRVTVDSDLSEWSSVLYNTESDVWSFGLTLIEDKLYASVKIKDKALVDEAIKNGILLNISYSNKKADGAKIIFPRLNFENLEKSLDSEELTKPFSSQELINSSKGYYVSGFNKFVDGLLSIHNTYGIHVSCKIDSTGVLNYESVVPLSLINFKTNEIAVELAVNTSEYLIKKMSPNISSIGNRRDVYGRGNSSQSSKNLFTEATSVWFMGKIK